MIAYSIWIIVKRHPYISAAIVGSVLLVPMIVIFFLFMVVTGGTTGDAPSCQNGGSSGGSYTANFAIKGLDRGQASVEKGIERWCASQKFSAAQTAGILANGFGESGLSSSTNGGNYLGISYGNVGSSHDGMSNSYDYMNHFDKVVANSPVDKPYWHKYEKMQSSSPFECGYFYADKIVRPTISGDPGYTVSKSKQRGNWAKQFYSQIAHGSSQVSDASDTSESGKGQSCQQSSSDDDSDGSDIIRLGKKYVGLGYNQSSRYQSIKDILAGKPKSETAENDCDGYDFAILHKLHYKVSKSYWGNVGGMDAYYRSQGMIIPKSESHAGTPCTYPPGAPDYGKLGHAFFLEEKWHGPSTKILEEGPNDVNSGHTVEWALTGGKLSDIHCYKLVKE